MNRRRRILVICPYPEHVAPGQRLKYEQYFSYFRENGYDVTVSSFMTRRFWSVVYKPGHILEKAWWTGVGYLRRAFDLLRAPRFDVVYVFLWGTPFGPPLFERLLAHASRRMIYDIDDMVFMGRTSPANRWTARLKGPAKVVYLTRHAAHVITCTPSLESFVREHNDHTTDISSTIDTLAYVPAPRRPDDRRLTLGWSGSHTTSEYLLLIEDVLRDLKREHEFDILVIGDPTFRFANLACEVLPWRRETEVRDLQRIDIGLYPLPDDPWVYGKSGLKALQYMALEIPTVATAVGANFRVIEHGVSGYLVSTPEEWRATLDMLIRDPDKRRQIGIEARRRVVQHFSIIANRDRYLNILNSVVGRPAGTAP